MKSMEDISAFRPSLRAPKGRGNLAPLVIASPAGAWQSRVWFLPPSVFILRFFSVNGMRLPRRFAPQGRRTEDFRSNGILSSPIFDLLRFWSPVCASCYHDVEYCQQFTHACYYGDLIGLASGAIMIKPCFDSIVISKCCAHHIV